MVSRPPALRGLAVPLTLTALIGLGGVALDRVYAGSLLAQLVLGAAVGSVAVSVAARRLPSWVVAPLSALTLAGYVGLALRAAARLADLPEPFGQVLREAAGNAIPRLLTAMIPIEPVPDTVLVPVVAAWLTGLAGAELMLRANRILLGYVPPMLFYAGALYVVGPNAEPALWPTIAFAAVAVIGLAVDGPARLGPLRQPECHPTRPSSPIPSALLPVVLRARLAVGTAAGVAAVVTLITVIAPVVAAEVRDRPVDPRRYVQPPVMDSLDENPLIRISGWALNPDQKLFDIRSSVERAGGGPAADGDPDAAGGTGDRSGPANGGLRVRLAVLSDYDGVTWRADATYRNAGRVLPAVTPHPGAVTDIVRQEITIGDLSGRLMPAVSTPQTIMGARVGYDPASGTLIHPERLTPGLRYTVISLRERPAVNQLAAADVPAGEQVAPLLRLGEGVPEQMRRLAMELSVENGAPYERALAIEQFLAEHYRLVADAPSGHAYPNLDFFLFGPRDAGGQRGTSEQFAAAFAVLGRLMGLPTRIVVGFHSPTGNGPVHAAEAYAWPEVLFDDIGWVAFDPLPQPDSEPRPVEEDFRPEPEQSSPPSPEPPASASSPTPSPPPPAASTTPADDRRSPPPLALTGAGLTVLLALFGSTSLIIGLRRIQRRRRLYEGPPSQRIVGAWLETMDALRLAGRPAAGHLPATEVAAFAQEVAAGSARKPVPPIHDLAVLVNRACFAPDETTEAEARVAVTQAATYVAALRAGQRWWRRLLWSVHPGPLRWRD